MKRRTHGIFVSILAIVTLISCARAIILNTKVALKPGEIKAGSRILVSPVVIHDLEFVGDKANDETTNNREIELIKNTLPGQIVNELIKLNFQPELVKTSPENNDVVLVIVVRRYNRGSGVLRLFFGMGAGASDLFYDLKIHRGNSDSILCHLGMASTSGNRGGIFAATSHLKMHLEDAAKEIAEHIKNNSK